MKIKEYGPTQDLVVFGTFMKHLWIVTPVD